MPLSQRVRARLRDELSHRKLSQRKAADRLTRQTGERWTQSKLHKILTGQVQLLVDDMEAIAALVSLPHVELVREPGREFVADLTPSELKLLTIVRDAPDLLQLLITMSAKLSPPRKPGRRTVRERMRADTDT